MKFKKFAAGLLAAGMSISTIGAQAALPADLENAGIDTVCDHIFHFLELDPDGKHIALGGDLDGCSSLPSGIAGIQDYPALAQRLLDRGVTENMIHDIFWNNAIEVIKRCCT